MNKLNSGTLMVIIATIITAVFILLTDRVTPESTKQAHNSTIAKNDAAKVDDQVIDKVDVEPITALSDTESPVIKEEVTDTQAVSESQDEAKEVLAPDGPFAKSDDKPTVNEVSAKPDPIESSEKVESEDSSETTKELPEVVFVNPSTFVATTEQHEVLDHIVQPIWMDQKLGDFKSIEESSVVFKIMPAGADGIQGENPEGVVTSKSDRFSSTVVPKNYNYQQMPMYNGGYYIAPMPSYLMSSVLPGKSGIKSQKDKTEN